MIRVNFIMFQSMVEKSLKIENSLYLLLVLLESL
jgi:hypothetical protein